MVSLTWLGCRSPVPCAVESNVLLEEGAAFPPAYIAACRERSAPRLVSGQLHEQKLDLSFLGWHTSWAVHATNRGNDEWRVDDPRVKMTIVHRGDGSFDVMYDSDCCREPLGANGLVCKEFGAAIRLMSRLSCGKR